MPVAEQSNEERLKRWQASSGRRKFWRTPNRGAWTASIEDETGQRVSCSAKDFERACGMLLGLMRAKGLL